MSPKLKGILVTPVVTIAILVLGIAWAFAVQGGSDGWAALGAIIMMMFGIGLSFIVELIVGLVLYYKKESPVGLGILIGLGGTIGFLTMLGFVMRFAGAFM